MAKVIFYEKPGCAGNARQKTLLVESGHEVEARNLLTTPWTAASLRPFFGTRPTGEWFNRSAPRIKSGEIRPDILSPEAALTLLIADPSLIRRPLMQVGTGRQAGFEQDRVAAWIGLDPTAHAVTEACLRATPCAAPPPARDPKDEARRTEP
jgi:nitrogenase-associated protein